MNLLYKKSRIQVYLVRRWWWCGSARRGACVPPCPCPSSWSSGFGGGTAPPWRPPAGPSGGRGTGRSSWGSSSDKLPAGQDPRLQLSFSPVQYVSLIVLNSCVSLLSDTVWRGSPERLGVLIEQFLYRKGDIREVRIHCDVTLSNWQQKGP